MSIDVSVRLFFPMSSASDALRALAEILRCEEGGEVEIALPGGGSFSIPVEDEFGANSTRPHVLDVGASIDEYDSVVSAVVLRDSRALHGWS